MGLGWASPDPGLGMAIEMLRGNTGDVGDIVVIGQRLSGKGFAPKDPPPAFNQVQPGRSHRNEGVLDAGMNVEPLPDGSTGVAGEIVGNQVEVSARVRAVHGLKERQIATGVARKSGLGQRLASAWPSRTERDP
jgi:hypothetical protein